MPVVPISAAKNEGIDELVEHALHVAQPPRDARPHRFLRRHRWHGRRGAPLHPRRGPPDRGPRPATPGCRCGFAATKLVEGDQLIEAAWHLDENETELLEPHHRRAGRRDAAWTARLPWRTCALPLSSACATRPWCAPAKAASTSAAWLWTSVLTGKYTALPCFIGIMALVFWLTFGVIGACAVRPADTGHRRR